MKKSNKIIMTVVIVAVLLLGIGYAAIQNITLNIAGTASADPSQANFKVMFSGTPTVSDDTYVTAAITDDTNATVNVEGLTKKGDIVTATYTVQNASTDLSADLGVSTTNSNTEYFTLSSEIAQTSLVAGEATNLTVTVELTKTPITDSVSTTIGVQLEAMPVQPGEEGTSEGINGSSQTPNGTNEYGFYYDRFYANQDEGFGFIAHEDESAEMFSYILSGEIEGLESDEWMCIDYFSAGELDFNEMITDGVTISKEGKIINMDGVDYEILDVDLHGLYYGCEYSIETDNNRESILVLKENGTVQLTTYENGEIIEDIVEDNFLTPIANGYLMTYGNQLVLSANPSGEVVAFVMVEGVFTLKEKHNYVSEKTKNVSCTEDGEIKNTCLDCNKTYTFSVLAPNHPNDVDNDGICDDCGETITYTDFEVDSYNSNMIGYSDTTTDLVIPETFYDEATRAWYKVTRINSYAFDSCTNLTSVVIPEGVTTIGNDAFRDCTNITNVVLPNSIKTIGDYAFISCKNLKNINIPRECASISYSAFTNCSALTEINVDSNNLNYSSIDGILCSKDSTILVRYPEGKTQSSFIIPEGITTIGYYAFNNCDNLTSIIIPEGVTTIEEHVFTNCDGLISIVIPEGVTTVESATFINCSKLTNVILPKSLTTIEGWAFQGCDNLANINIPEGVTSINHGVFLSCSNLSSIVIPKEVISIENSAFSGCYMLNTVNYTGTKEQWDAIQIGTENEDLTGATINYNYVIPTE